MTGALGDAFWNESVPCVKVRSASTGSNCCLSFSVDEEDIVDCSAGTQRTTERHVGMYAVERDKYVDSYDTCAESIWYDFEVIVTAVVVSQTG